MSSPHYIMVDVPIDRSFYRDVVAGAARYAREHPREIRLRTRITQHDQVLIPGNARIDGTITIVSDFVSKPSAEMLSRPLVNVSSASLPVPFPTVTVDSFAIGKMAAEHLVGQGYRHFGCHFESRAWLSRERLRGFSQKLRELGHECATFDTAPGASCVMGLQSTAASRDATIEWLRHLPKPLGLFTHNEARAEMLIDICRDAELNVGHDVGLISGNNDDLFATATSPTLTCIDSGVDEVGYRAMEMIVQLIRGQSVPLEPVFVPPRRVIVRESTQMVLEDDELLGLALTYIRQHATDPITINDVLEVVPISRRSLERRFRERLACSPGDEIRRVQIEKARQLLSRTDRALKAVARECGYNEFRTFAYAFRHQTGMNPSSYRRKFRQM